MIICSATKRGADPLSGRHAERVIHGTKQTLIQDHMEHCIGDA